MTWQDAVAELTSERGRAEAAAALIARLGGPSDVAIAELTYGDGRAEAEAVVSALIVALRQGSRVDDPDDLKARMASAVAARETLGRQARALVEAAPGEKGVVVDLLKVALPGLLGALGTLCGHLTKEETDLRATIAERLEAARWPRFAKVGNG
jgi:hypothetical protein